MGEPWVDHPSWEVVEEASAATDRDLSHLLLRAEMEELTQTEIAGRIGVSQMQVSRLLRQSLDRLRALTQPPTEVP